VTDRAYGYEAVEKGNPHVEEVRNIETYMTLHLPCRVIKSWYWMFNEKDS